MCLGLIGWVKDAYHYVGNNVYKVLVGDNCHTAQREVSRPEASSFAQLCAFFCVCALTLRHGMDFFEVSCSTQENLHQVMNHIAKRFFVTHDSKAEKVILRQIRFSDSKGVHSADRNKKAVPGNFGIGKSSRHT